MQQLAQEYLKYPFPALGCTLILSSCLNVGFLTCQGSKKFLCTADSSLEPAPGQLHNLPLAAAQTSNIWVLIWKHNPHLSFKLLSGLWAKLGTENSVRLSRWRMQQQIHGSEGVLGEMGSPELSWCVSWVAAGSRYPVSKEWPNSQLMLVKGLFASECRFRYCLTQGVQKDLSPAFPLIYAHHKTCPSQHLRRQRSHLPLRTKATEGHRLGDQYQAVPVMLERLKEFCLSLFWGELASLRESWLQINATGFGLNRFSCRRTWTYLLFWAQIFWRTANEGVQQKNYRC